MSTLVLEDTDSLVDTAALAADLDRVAAGGARDRGPLVALLKQTLADGRAKARALLEADGAGTRCAERLSHLMDEVVRAAFGYAARHLYPSDNPSKAERLAIVAVGGYGRGTLAPGSDVDLLFLRPYKQTAWGESIVETVLYTLWDLGLKVGHATRSLDECIRLARSDMTIRTAVLEARYVAGDEALCEELLHRFDREIVEGSTAEFVAAKLAERDERVRKAGSSRYLVEPNVKDGKGGLRDLNTLYWIAKYAFRVRDVADLVGAGLFSAEELRLFQKCEDFLWAVRCHLHFLSGRAEERLAFEVQRDIAVKLGYTNHPGQRDVERFMKHYFLVAKDVGDLTAILCTVLEERQAKPRPTLDRFLKPFRRSRRRELPGTSDFIVENDRLTVRDTDVFKRDPVNLIRFFHIAARNRLALHPDGKRLVTQSLKLIDRRLRDNPEANRLFLEILTSQQAAETVLRHMNEAGVLGRFVPAFGRVVAMMQFNMYHHYTVDEHLLRSIGVLAEIDRGQLGDQHPLANEIMPTIANKAVLYVALFLHDIAKGRPEDHSIAGRDIARELGPRLGFSEAETEQIAWLVEHHLLMSITAQSRDLSDTRTIADFANTVQSLERLKMLLVLTIADIKAVGPGVWNGWKGQLLRTLYWETELVLAGGHSTANRTTRVKAAQDELRQRLAGWPDAEVEAYLARHYPSYWLRAELDRRVSHAYFLRQAAADGKPMATRVATDAFRGVTELTILAPDHPRLLSMIAGTCAAAGASIVDANINTTTDGLALDTIFIRRGFEADEDEIRRGQRIADGIEKALRGEVRLPEIVERRAAATPRGRSRAFEVAPHVLVTNSWSDRHTVIEVTGLDRPGLLYELTSAISKLSLNIQSAHIATFGERAVDVFYVTDLCGDKIANSGRAATIRRTLLGVLGFVEEETPRVAKRTEAAG